MELENIIVLMKAFDQSSLSGLHLEQEGNILTLEAASRGSNVQTGMEVKKVKTNKPLVIREGENEMPMLAKDATATDTTVTESAAPIEAPAASKEGDMVKAPLVGTFFSAASPEAPPFVKVGDYIKKGQIVGIVEAMKLMNEIESEFEGVVQEVLVSNEEMVEYGQPLFLVR